MIFMIEVVNKPVITITMYKLLLKNWRCKQAERKIIIIIINGWDNTENERKGKKNENI